MAMLQWRRIDPPNDFMPRAAHSIAVVANKSLYVIGGKNGERYSDLIHVYDTEKGQWRRSMTAPFPPRMYCACTFVSGKIWVMGGANDDGVCDDVWTYDLRNTTWERQTISGPQHLLKRTAMAVVRSPVDRDTIILHGGYGPTPDNPDNVYSSQLVVLDTKRLTVKLLTPRGGGVPSGRAHHSMAALGSSLVVYGGKADTVLAPVPLAVFDYPKRRWSYPEAEGADPGLRSSHRTVVWRDAMLLFGGHDGRQSRLGDLHMLRHDGGRWTWSQELQPVIGMRPVGRASAGVAAVDNDLYILGGYAGHRTYLSDAWSLRLVDEAPECQPDYGGSERQEGAWRGAKRRRGRPLAELQDGTPDGIEDDGGGGADGDMENQPRSKRASGAIASATAAELRTAKAQHAQQMRELESENGRLHRQVAALQAELAQQRQGRTAVEAELADKVAALEDADGRVNQLKATEARQRLDLEGLQRSADELQHKLDAVSAEKGQAEEKLRKESEERRTADRAAYELSERLRATEAEAASSMQAHERSMTALNKALAEAQDVRRREAADRDAAQAQLAAQTEAHNKELAARQAQLDTAREELLSERKSNEETLRQRNTAIEELQQSLQVARKRADEALEGKAKAQGSLATLQHSHGDMEARYDDMQKKTTTAQNDVVRLTAERNTLQHRLSQLKEMDMQDVGRHEHNLKNAVEACQTSLRWLDEQRRRCAE